jgi:serine protease AprX
VEAAIADTSIASTVGRQPRTAGGLGSLDASRGGSYVVADCDGVLREIRGEIDVRCQPWDPVRWTQSAWTGEAWAGPTWTGSAWNAVAWKSVDWSDAHWNAVGWKGGTWTGGAWQGTTGWNGDVTPTSAWTAVGWKDATWTAVGWKEASWTTGDWTTGSYDEFLTAFWGATPPAGRYLPGETYTPLPERAQQAASSRLPFLAP